METKIWVEHALKYAVSKITENTEEFFTKVPSPASIKNRYLPKENNYWTASFWIGQLWLAKEYTMDSRFDDVINAQMNEFKKRLDEKIELNHHDIGFLYSLSAVAQYRLTGSESAKKMIVEAADELMKRYHSESGIIQAWGNLDNMKERGRMIIDCNMNLPLLYVASQLTGNSSYKQVAYGHAKQAKRYIIRKDYSTYHTYYMDPVTGAPKYGKTAQGFSDSSCWARGQAWGVYGFALSYTYTGDASFLEAASKLADYFLMRLPDDFVCYWDLDFTSGDEERDSSAASILVCGLLELSKQLPLADPNKERYNQVALKILYALATNYTTAQVPKSNGLLLHAVYAKPDGKGVDECCIWGDYFYMEALIRVSKSWYSYW